MARMLAPINTVKHYNERTLFAVGSGLIQNLTEIVAVVSPDANNAVEVVEGAIIKAIYIELWITSDDAAQGTFTFSLEKINTTQTDMTAAENITKFSYSNKKNIFYSTMGLTPPNIQSGIPIVRQWFKIPKGKQRFGLGDQLNMNLSGPSNGISACGFSTYKEFR